jgi:hypothetical protein
MMTQTYQQLIEEGVRGLPADALRQITDFVYFIRQRATAAEQVDEDYDKALTRIALKRLSQSEQAHLEQEFEGYAQRYPEE